MAHGVSIAQPAPSLQLDAEAEPQEAAPQAIEPVGAIETHESTPAPLRPATPPPTEAPASPSPTTTRRPPRPTTAAQEEEEESSDEEEVFLLFLCFVGVD